jgi:hypothetical protein
MPIASTLGHTIHRSSKSTVNIHRVTSVVVCCHSLGKSFDLVAGSVIVGNPSDEYICSHEHHDCGGPTYYAAFLIDPDGNNVEAVCLK